MDFALPVNRACRHIGGCHLSIRFNSILAMLVEVYGHAAVQPSATFRIVKTLILHNNGRLINLSGFKQPTSCHNSRLRENIPCCVLPQYPELKIWQLALQDCGVTVYTTRMESL